MKHNPLANISIVLTETTLPANIGSTARAMMTMGLQHLLLVNPKHPIDETSIAFAKGGAVLLEQAIIYPTLSEALSSQSLVIAASARSRHTPRPMLTPDSAATLIKTFSQAQPSARIAIVFGREDRGLTNAELTLADYHLQIPANPNYPVLNVASSVQVIASYLYQHLSCAEVLPNSAQHPLMLRSEWDSPPITHAEKQALIDALLELFGAVELSQSDKLPKLTSRLWRLAARLQLDKTEHQLLMALAFQLQKRLSTPPS